jgi:uncharacterized membrane protein
MIEFLILILTLAIAWLIYNFLNLRDRVAFFNSRSGELFRRLATMEADLQQLRKELPHRMGGPVPVAPTPESAGQQLEVQLPATPMVSTAAITPHAPKVPESPATQIPVFSPVILSMEGIDAEAAATSAASGEVFKQGGHDARFALPAPGAPARAAEPTINWERFLGVNLFAWVGGLALFLGVAFFIKYAFEHDLISPAMRVVIGLAVGLGALVTGLWLSRERYAATVQTLCGSGILILYADVFASHAFYHFIDPLAAFALMSLVTATAFLLAVRLEAQPIAILGLLGGFLTPPLLSTGEDRPVGLFSYVALLDAGLIAVALHRRWDHLVLLSGAATVVMELGWNIKFFSIDNVETAMTVFASFSFFYLGAWRLFYSRGTSWGYPTCAALLQCTFSFMFAFILLVGPYAEVAADRPWLLFGYVILIDLGVLVMAYADPVLRLLQHLAGGAVFLLLSIWTTHSMTGELIYWALAFFLLFTVLHSVAPVVFERLRPGGPSVRWAHLFPPAAVLLTLAPLVMGGVPSAFLWLAMILLNMVGLGLTVATGFLAPFTIMLVLTLITIGIWVMEGVARDLLGLEAILLPLGVLALLFFGAGVFLLRRIARDASSSRPPLGLFVDGGPDWNSPALVPILSSALPFVLLAQVAAVLKVADPSPVFGMALLFTVLLLGLVRYLDGMAGLAIAPLAGVLLVEHVWHCSNFTPEGAFLPLLWYLLFPLILGIFPFLFPVRCRESLAPWLASALAAPLHFYLVYQAVHLGYPNPYMGVVPAAFAVVSLLGLLRLLRLVKQDHPQRLTLLALFAGVSLFFITLIFPVQLDRQWLTLGWALEGVALIWLMRRIPHEGLRISGTVLLAISFARLALNPYVFEYHARGGMPVFNWYLYSYGIVAACLILGAKMLPPAPRDTQREYFGPVLCALGGVLAFMLLNIEIVDYFSEGEQLSFEFGGNFARDMTYSLAWGLFAFIVMIIGIRGRSAGARYAGIGLLTITLLKLFFHDLWLLGGLYRIGSFVGLAVLLILVSFLYQRFLGTNIDRNSTKGTEKT